MFFKKAKLVSTSVALTNLSNQQVILTNVHLLLSLRDREVDHRFNDAVKYSGLTECLNKSCSKRAAVNLKASQTKIVRCMNLTAIFLTFHPFLV